MECGSVVRLTWGDEPLPTPLGLVDLGFGVCSCGGMACVIEGNPPDMEPAFLQWTLYAFSLGAIAALQHLNITTGEAVPLDATQGAHHGKQHH